MDIDEKLKRLCDEADGRAEERFLSGVAGVLDELAQIILCGSWSAPSDSSLKNLKAEIEGARDAAGLADSSRYLRDQYLKRGSGGSGIEDRIPKSWDGLKELLRTWIEDGELDDGGVYVAWSGAPYRFYYVGKASGPERLQQLDRHGKLARATAPRHATNFSLLVPGVISERAILDLESAVLRVVTECKGQPVFNERCEPPPSGQRRRDLQSIAAILRRTADSLDAD